MMKRCIVLMLTIIITGIVSQTVKGQHVAIKTNLVADAVLSPNFGIEIGLAPKWTLDATGQLNLWTLSGDRRWKHWAVQPESRYWFCDRFSGHFLGVHIHGGQYNLGGFNGYLHFLGTDARKLANARYQGWFVGAGVAYGYAWILSRHWNLETEIGIGYSYTRYDKYPCADCGTKLEENMPHHYVGITKLAINLVYLF